MMEAVSTSRSRSTLLLFLAFVIYWLAALRLDIGTDARGQFFLGLTSWAFLLFSLRFSPWRERGQVLTMIGVATCGECFGSLLWGAYTYRLDNLPVYVPPGHGLFYLYALRIAELPLFRSRTQLLRWSTFFVATALLLPGLLNPFHRDIFGLITWLGFMVCLIRSPSPMYSVSFILTMALEYYGTGLGNWKWASELPGLGIPAANPPACIGVGYCAMDAVARRLAPEVERFVVGRKAFKTIGRASFPTFVQHHFSRPRLTRSVHIPSQEADPMIPLPLHQHKVEALSVDNPPSSYVKSS